MLVFPLVEVNKLSKVYKQNQNTKVFANVDEAKKHFLTDEAIEQYNKYCYNQKWALADDSTSLHWTQNLKTLIIFLTQINGMKPKQRCVRMMFGL